MAAKKKAVAKKAPAKKKAVKKVATKPTTPEQQQASEQGGEQQQQPSTTTNAGTHTGVAAELMKATGVTPNEGEAFSAFAVRLTEAMAKLPDDDYNKLGEVGRKWFDDAVDPINAKQYDKIGPLPGFVATTPPAGSSGDPVADANAATAGGKAAKTPKAPKEPKAARTPKAPKEPRGPRVGLVIAEMVAKNNKLTYEQLVERVTDGGKKKIDTAEGSYIHSRYEEAKHCVATMNAKK